MKKEIIIVIAIMVISLYGISRQRKADDTSHQNYVPNEQTAIKIAEAIWLPIYGESIYKEKPYKAVLYKDSTWVVTGSLPSNYIVGGTLYIKIRKSDCKILRVFHGK